VVLSTINPVSCLHTSEGSDVTDGSYSALCHLKSCRLRYNCMRNCIHEVPQQVNELESDSKSLEMALVEHATFGGNLSCIG